MSSLSDVEIQRRFDEFSAKLGPGSQLYGHLIARVNDTEWALARTREELTQPEVHRRLLASRSATTSGGRDLSELDTWIGNPGLSQLFIDFRFSILEPDAMPRARHLHNLYETHAKLAESAASATLPTTRVHRALGLLLPSEFVEVPQERLLALANLLGTTRMATGVAGASMARARLRQVLGKEDDVREHVSRSLFCLALVLSLKDQMTQTSTPQVVQPSSGAEPAAQETTIPSTHPTGSLSNPPPPGHGLGSASAASGVTSPPLKATVTIQELERFWKSPEVVKAFAGASDNTYRRTVENVLEAIKIGSSSGSIALNDELLPILRSMWANRGLAQATVNQYACHWRRFADLATEAGLEVPAFTPRRILDNKPLSPPSPMTAATDSDEAKEPTEADVNTEDAGAVHEPTLSKLRELFEDDDQTAGLIFPPAMFRGLYAAWSFHTRKRFALLSGLSGTGKTELLKHTARLTCEHMDLDEDKHVALIAVNPDWRDPSGLLGHLSTLHNPPIFHAEAALRLVLRAANDPGRPYFLLLDEMNLAPVERYFAPFLSAMESGADLLLHGEDDEVNGVPPRVAWPSNLRIGGTVNMDETTYPFSDKVLDRAFTFEFWEVNIEALFEARGTERPTEEAAQAALRALQAQLVPIRRHVGYRALTEALDWIAACHQHDPEAPIHELIDEAVFAKVLPRLRGSESSALSTALAQIQKVCVEHKLSRCQLKVQQMAARLTETGVTGFWS